MHLASLRSRRTFPHGPQYAPPSENVHKQNVQPQIIDLSTPPVSRQHVQPEIIDLVTPPVSNRSFSGNCTPSPQSPYEDSHNDKADFLERGSPVPRGHAVFRRSPAYHREKRRCAYDRLRRDFCRPPPNMGQLTPLRK